MHLLRRRAVLLWRLGPRNVLRVTLYRLGLRFRLHPVCHLRGFSPQAPFFFDGSDFPLTDVGDIVSPRWKLFGWYDVHLEGNPPDWFRNLQTGQRVPDPERPWWEIPDFSDVVGDIKAIWELSRFDWVPLLVLCARHDRPESLATLDAWLSDWLQCNPPYRGPNWKCGQEASIRVINLVFAALLLDRMEHPSRGVMELVRLHLRRIQPTLSYALGQANNHGTTEAAALFVGGSWLHRIEGDRQARRWADKGRSVLEERTRTLFAPDGSFSQYSTNYHRLALSTLCAAETWRQRMGLPAFSRRFYTRAELATRWLFCFVNSINGEAPNLGANDGARLLPLSATDFRDYRPELEWASNLFCSSRAFPGDRRHDVLSREFGVAIPGGELKACGSAQFDDGGYAVLRSGEMCCFLRYPRYRFRPRHADALHVDLWQSGTNWLRDGGSYSYNTQADWERYFPATAAHNTVEFDGRDQMPRIGRFLRAEWLSIHDIQPVRASGETVTAAAAYRDWKGARHHRSVTVNAAGLQVHDQVSGFAESAVLRWRLRPGEWFSSGNGVESEGAVIRVMADVPIERCELVEGWESRYYMQKTALPVLEVEVRESGILVTEFILR